MPPLRYIAKFPIAQRIFDKFGGARRLARLIGRNPSALYKWNHPRSQGGLDGLVPTKAVPDIKSAADLMGIDLTASDWAP